MNPFMYVLALPAGNALFILRFDAFMDFANFECRISL